MKQVHKYIISVFGKYHSQYDNESDAQDAVNCIENGFINVFFEDGTCERLTKPLDSYFKVGSIM